MTPINVTLLKYTAIAVIVIGLLGGAYYKGVSDTSAEYELKIMDSIIELSNSITKVEQASNDIADNIDISNRDTSTKLDYILRNSKVKTLTSVPCTPTLDFTSSWNQLNKETK